MKDEDVLREWLKASGAVPGLFILLENLSAKAKLGETEIVKAKREVIKHLKSLYDPNDPQGFLYIFKEELAALDKEAGT